MPGWLKSPRSARACNQEASASHSEETSYQVVCSRCLPCHPCWSVPQSSPTSSQLTHHLLLCPEHVPPHLAFLKSPFPECYLLCNCREGAFVLLPEVTSLQTSLSWESPSSAPSSVVSSCPFSMLAALRLFPCRVSAKTLLVSLVVKLYPPVPCKPVCC